MSRLGNPKKSQSCCSPGISLDIINKPTNPLSTSEHSSSSCCLCNNWLCTQKLGSPSGHSAQSHSCAQRTKHGRAQGSSACHGSVREAIRQHPQAVEPTAVHSQQTGPEGAVDWLFGWRLEQTDATLHIQGCLETSTQARIVVHVPR